MTVAPAILSVERYWLAEANDVLRSRVKKMIGHPGLLTLAALAAAAGLSGCAGLASLPPLPQPQPTSVIFSVTPPSSMAVNASVTIDAAAEFSVPDSSENTAVTYSLRCGSANACGQLSASDELGAIVYTAPAAIPSGGTVTVTATSMADTSLSASAAITIVPPVPISVSLAGALPASMQVNATISMGAMVANDVSTNPQVTWSATCSGGVCGSFKPTTTDSDAQTVYTAPAAIPPGGDVTVTATSVTDPAKSASGSIVITAAAPALANGTYVFQAGESGENEAASVTGVLTAQNGSITGGEQDAIYGGDSDYSEFQQISSGSYTTTPGGNVLITLQMGPDNTEILSGTLASNQKGFISGIDGSLANGTLELQTSTVAPSGGYVFSLDAADVYEGEPWITGIVNVDSAGGISGNGSILDVNNEAAWYSGAQTIAPSTVSPPDAQGRVLFQLNPSASSSLPVLLVAGYIVDGSQIRLIDVGDPNNSYVVVGPMAGVALAQGANTGKFTAASLAGTSYVFGAEGEGDQGILELAGVLKLNAGGSVSGTLNWNDLSNDSPQAPLAATGAWTVDPTGRLTVSNLTDGSTFTYSLHLYLNGSGGGLVLSDDQNDVFAGQTFQQQAAAFGAASFSGNYGLNASVYTNSAAGVPAYVNAAGVVVATPGSGVDNVAGFVDATADPYDFAVSGSFTPAASGVFTGTLSGFSSSAPTSPNSFTLYMVDDTQAVAIETDNAQLTLARLSLVQ
jgi:hypothetical protein